MDDPFADISSDEDDEDSGWVWLSRATTHQDLYSQYIDVVAVWLYYLFCYLC